MKYAKVMIAQDFKMCLLTQKLPDVAKRLIRFLIGSISLSSAIDHVKKQKQR